MTTDDISKIRKPQTRLKRTQFALRLHRKDEDNLGQLEVEESEVYFYIYSFFEHL